MKTFLKALKLMGILLITTIVAMIESITEFSFVIYGAIAFALVSLIRGAWDGNSVIPALIVTGCFHLFIVIYLLITEEKRKARTTQAEGS